jgi:hypothetical protein
VVPAAEGTEQKFCENDNPEGLPECYFFEIKTNFAGIYCKKFLGSGSPYAPSEACSQWVI